MYKVSILENRVYIKLRIPSSIKCFIMSGLIIVFFLTNPHNFWHMTLYFMDISDLNAQHLGCTTCVRSSPILWFCIRLLFMMIHFFCCHLLSVIEHLACAECDRQWLLRLPMIIFWYLCPCVLSFTCVWVELSDFLLINRIWLKWWNVTCDGRLQTMISMLLALFWCLTCSTKSALQSSHE